MTYTQMSPEDISKLRMCDRTECWMPGVIAFGIGAVLVVAGFLSAIADLFIGGL